MHYKSASTANPDAYRAGSEIGEAFYAFRPEVILIFASIVFENDFTDFFAGLYDGLGTHEVIVCGGTGDGIYETCLTANYGVCALAITSQRQVLWSTTIQQGVYADSYQAARECIQAALSQTADPSWAFVLADGVNADGTGIVDGIKSLLSIPFVGGLTGDDRKFTRSRIFLNGQAIEDAVLILLAKGPLPFSTNAASGWTPLGSYGVVEKCCSRTVQTIDGQTALAFVEEQLGKPLAEADLGVTPLAVYDNISSEQFSLRAPSKLEHSTGGITTFGSIKQGTMVRVCSADREQVLAGVSTSIAGIMDKGFKPSAAIIISCAGRKWVLDDCGSEEVAIVTSILGDHIPLIGFPSFGEIGPYQLEKDVYSETLFHNVTFVICLLG